MAASLSGEKKTILHNMDNDRPRAPLKVLRTTMRPQEYINSKDFEQKLAVKKLCNRF